MNSFRNCLLLFLLVVAVYCQTPKAPQTGPCVLGTHKDSHKLKCTSNGYFELVQCFDQYCVCVDPTTGHSATETITSSSKIAPQCGMCHKKLSVLFSTSVAPRDVPQCEAKTGDFVPLQCHQSENVCFCVTPQTGVEIRGTRGPKGTVRCTNVDFSIDSSKGLSVFTDKKQGLDNPVANDFCKLPKASGSVCNGKPKRLQYYFDYESFECLAFEYQGCGGNDNRYDTVEECWSKCKMADFGTCSGNIGPYLEADGNARICHTGFGPDKECPKGYVCQMFAFMGLCCDKANQDMFLRNYRPTCREGQRPHKLDLNGMPWTLLGKSCSDNFCPAGTTCHKQEIFAHCCETHRTSRSAEKTPNSISNDDGAVPEELPVELAPQSQGSDPDVKPKVCAEGPIRWYFERSVSACVAYRSCSGNITGWPTPGTCMMRLNRVPMDIGPCSTWRTALYNFDAVPSSPSVICDGPGGKQDCPKGFSCRRGAFFAVCCNDAIEEMWTRNLYPTCKNGAHKLVKGPDARALIGHRCEDNFCPEDSTCIQEEHLAHCCQR